MSRDAIFKPFLMMQIFFPPTSPLLKRFCESGTVSGTMLACSVHENSFLLSNFRREPSAIVVLCSKKSGWGPFRILHVERTLKSGHSLLIIRWGPRRVQEPGTFVLSSRLQSTRLIRVKLEIPWAHNVSTPLSTALYMWFHSQLEIPPS